MLQNTDIQQLGCFLPHDFVVLWDDSYFTCLFSVHMDSPAMNPELLGLNETSPVMWFSKRLGGCWGMCFSIMVCFPLICNHWKPFKKLLPRKLTAKAPEKRCLEDFRLVFSTWWFQTWFIFTPIWGNFPFWLIFFRWVETTNQFWNGPFLGDIR